MSDPQITSFANHVFIDWEDATSRFFERVERKAEARGLTDRQVRAALAEGYGDDIADSWDEWCDPEMQW